MAPKIRKKKKQASFTNNPNPLSPQLQPSLPEMPLLVYLDAYYRTLSSRINSYNEADTDWPHQHLSPIKLAAAGFYRLVISKKEDTTKCAFCAQVDN